MRNQKPQANLRAIASGLALLILIVFVCYILTGLVLTSAGYPMW